MRKLFKFYVDYGRHGDITGVFVADEAEVTAALGHTIQFDEPWGRHSSATCTLAADQFTVLTDDQDFIAKAQEYGVSHHGVNPLGILRNMREDGLETMAPVVSDGEAAGKLERLFTQMYSDTGTAMHMLMRCGVGREHLNTKQAPAAFWAEAYKFVDKLGLLPALVALALHDKSIAAWHHHLERAWKDREEARATSRGRSAALDPFAVIDSGRGGHGR